MKNLSASRVSLILIILLAGLLAVLVGGSVVAGSLLVKQSAAATHATIDADVSAGDVSRLEALKRYLATNSAGISQTASLTRGLGAYDQSSIIATISGYASRAGVPITSFDFGTINGGTAIPGASAASGGTVNLTLAPSVKYANFIVFLKLLEQGLMPAQVTSGEISADSIDPAAVNVSSLSVKVAQ